MWQLYLFVTCITVSLGMIPVASHFEQKLRNAQQRRCAAKICGRYYKIVSIVNVVWATAIVGVFVLFFSMLSTVIAGSL